MTVDSSEYIPHPAATLKKDDSTLPLTLNDE